MHTKVKEKVNVYTVIVFSIFILTGGAVDNYVKFKFYGIVMGIILMLFSLLKQYYKIGKIVIDDVGFWLLIRPFYLLFYILSTEDIVSYFLQYLFAILPSIIYVMIYNNNKLGKRTLDCCVTIFVSITVVAIIYSYFYIITQNLLSSASIKGYINTTYGGSNTIATMLIPFLVYLLFSENEGNRFKEIIISLCIVSTLSVAGVSILILIYTVFLLSKSIANKTKFLIVVVAILAIVLVLYTGQYTDRFTSRVTNLTEFNSIYEALDWLSNGRFEIYAKAIECFWEKPFFGWGLLGTSRDGILITRTHNLILDLLIKNGIIGGIIYISPLILIIHKSCKLRRVNKFNNSIAIIGIISLIYGMVEPNFYCHPFEVIIWYLIVTLHKIAKKEVEAS